MYNFLLFMLILVGYASDALSVVVLQPAPWDRNAPIAQIERKPGCVSYTRGEGASMEVVRGTLILKITSRPETLLQQAVVDNDIERVRQLLQAKEDPNIQNHHGFTALHFAAGLGYANLVELLLSYKANPNIVDDLAHAAPLHVASIAVHNVDAVELLIKYGADVNLPDVYGYTPLHIAAAINGDKISVMLLQAGAKINAVTFASTTAMMRSSSRALLSTALHEAAAHDSIDVLRLLLQRGASVEAKTGDDKMPFHLALMYGHTSVTRLFLKKGCIIEGAPEQSLIKAASAGDYEIVEFLITHGFDVNKAVIEKNEKSTWNNTPLCAACQSKNPSKMVQFLLEHGALANGIDLEGSTPLMCAVEFADEDTVQVLIDHGADVNKTINCGVTALHVAAYLNKISMAKLLLDNGARIGAETNKRKTPLQFAVEQKNQEMVDFLKSFQIQDKSVVQVSADVDFSADTTSPVSQQKNSPVLQTVVHDDNDDEFVIDGKVGQNPSFFEHCSEVVKQQPVVSLIAAVAVISYMGNAVKDMVTLYNNNNSLTHSIYTVITGNGNGVLTER